VAHDDLEWNTANSQLQQVLRDDPAFQGMAVEVEPNFRMVVVVEPGHVLNAASAAEIAAAQRLRPITDVQGVTPTAELESARHAVDAALRRVKSLPTTKGLVIRTDWLHGRVRITGDVEHGRAIATEAAVESRLVIVEDGPEIRRL
jgi:hypothetical protein